MININKIKKNKNKKLYIQYTKFLQINDIINNMRYLGILIETKLLKMRSTRLEFRSY